MHRVLWTAAALAAMSVSWANAAEQPPVGQTPEYPWPEEYVGTDRVDEYIDQARRYLEHETYPANRARVWLDLLMVALAEDRTELATEAKERLLYDHPDGPMTALVLRTFADADAYRTFLGERLDALKGNVPPEFVEKHCRAVQLGSHRWKEKFFSGDGFLVRTGLLAQLQGDTVLVMQCRGKLEESEDSAALGPILFDYGRTPSQRAIELHALAEDNRHARWAETFLLGRLTPEELALPEVLRIAAENALLDHDFEKALPLIERLPDVARDPQLRFWHAWTVGVEGQPQQAVEELDALARAPDGGVWSRMAADTVEHWRRRDELLGRYVGVAQQVMARLADNTQDLEAELQYGNDGEAPLTGYLAISFRDRLFDALMWREGALLLGYRTADEKIWLHIGGDDKILRFPGAGPVPQGRVNVERDEKGTFTWSTSWEMSTGTVDLQGFTGQLFNSPALVAGDAMDVLHKMAMNNGYVLAVPRRETGQTQYAWLRPRWTRPGFEPITYRVDDADQLTSLSLAPLFVKRLRYGPAGSVLFSPPAWPDVPEVAKEQLDTDTFMLVMARIAEILNPDMSAAGQQLSESVPAARAANSGSVRLR